MKYTLIGLDIVELATGSVVASYSEAFRLSAAFHCKILNGLVVPVWIDDVLIWVPPSMEGKRGAFTLLKNYEV